MHFQSCWDTCSPPYLEREHPTTHPPPPTGGSGSLPAVGLGELDIPDLPRCAALPAPTSPPTQQNTVQYRPAGELNSHLAGQVTVEGFTGAHFPGQAQQARSHRATRCPTGKSRRFAREHLRRSRSAGFMAWSVLANTFYYCTDRVTIIDGAVVRAEKGEALGNATGQRGDLSRVSNRPKRGRREAPEGGWGQGAAPPRICSEIAKWDGRPLLVTVRRRCKSSPSACPFASLQPARPRRSRTRCWLAVSAQLTARQLGCKTDAPQPIKVGHLFSASCPISKPVFFVMSLPTDTVKYISHLDTGADLWRTTCAERFDVERQISKDRKQALSTFLITLRPGSATD